MSGSVRPSRRFLFLVAAAVLAAAVTWALVARYRGPSLPGPGSATYEQVSTAFYLGLAALQVGLLEDATRDFARAAELVPDEPAVWANLGVARLRLGDLDAAAEPIGRALMLAPENTDVALLAARMEIARGRLDEGIAYLRRAVMLDPRALRARFTLAEELERNGTPEGGAEALRILDALQQLVPGNVAVLIERARVAAGQRDAVRLNDSVAKLEDAARSWPPIALEQFQLLRSAAAANDPVQAARGTALLRNVLARVPAYAADVTMVRTPADIVAEPFDRFLALAAPVSMPAAPDLALTFATAPLGTGPVSAIVAASLDGREQPIAFGVEAGTLRRLDSTPGAWPLPDSMRAGVLGPFGLLAVDWNNDFRTDFLVAGTAGVRLLLQNETGGFIDTTATAAGGSPVACRCTGAWAADIEMDGDLDIVLGAMEAPAIVLRNGGDGTWTLQQTFASIIGLRQFAWADLDGDADPDAAFLDAAGLVHVLGNRQAGQFTEVATPTGLGNIDAMTVADLNADGRFDLVVSSSAGIRRISMTGTDDWGELEAVAQSEAAGGASPATVLLAADLDNNGALDLIRTAAASQIWMADEHHRFIELPSRPGAPISAVADLNQDGHVDLLGGGSPPVQVAVRGSKGYHWKQIHVRAQPTAGDQRVNSFGVGGEIEVRSGLLRQKQVLTGLPSHFGLGTRTSIDVARIVWPNGIPQAEFGPAADDAVVAEQRLKGSCPWVFAYDGQGMQFVTDFLWRSPLGLRINAQDTAGVSQTEDWVRIRGDQLASRDGFYDVRITAELWETHYFDHVSLLAVDHPADASVFVDERFSARPVAFAPHAFRELRPVQHAADSTGRDVSDLVSRQDNRHVATFERGRYQGIATEHAIEFDADPRAETGRLTLIAQGWVYPTDSSINVAVGQGRHEAPHGIALEAQDGAGVWRTINPDLGFPAGKNKTMLIDVSGTGHARRLRLRTNMEVYWDALMTAVPTDGPVRTVRLAAARADLRYRGYSHTTSPRGDAPETPSYAPVEARGQRWRDLTGYHTRFGDVRELIGRVDDRYVIMNAGDELAMQFPVPADPEVGWRRDFILIGDGWEKDGDYNTEFSQTVLPLPSHGARPYDPGRVPRALEDDPVYKRHPEDWERYHTRYVTPRTFARGLAADSAEGR